jgi:hypothetical protein
MVYKTSIHPLFRLFSFISGLLLLLGGMLWLQMRYLLWGEWSYDQGYYLLVARLMDHGYQLYAEIFMSEPPLMGWSIGLPFAFFGSVAGMQVVMVFFSLLGIAALLSIGISLDGKLTGLLAGALLVLSFDFFVVAGKVMPEVPSMSLALVSLALALRYHTGGHRLALALSGVVMGCSLQIKYYMPWLIPLMILIIVIPFDAPLSSRSLSQLLHSRKRIGSDLLLWVGSLLLTVLLLSLSASNLSALFDQTILFHLLKSVGAERNLMGNVDMIWRTFTSQPVLSGSALLGLAIMLSRFKTGGWVAIIWLVLSLIFLFTYSPLRSKHLVLLTPILALLAAFAIVWLLLGWHRFPHYSKFIRWGTLLAGTVLLYLLVLKLLGPFQVLANPRREMIDEDLQPLMTVLEHFTAPSDCLITDHPYLAFVANRMPPPWFSALSYARFASGSLDVPEMVEITNHHNCQVAAPILDRVKNAKRSYYDWAKANYLRVWVLEGNEIMLGKPMMQAQPEIPLSVNFNGQVELMGADWHPVEDGGYLSLYWKTMQPFSQDYKIFVQLRNAQGQIVASADHEAYNGLIPTQAWPVQAILKDTNRLNWPPDLPHDTHAFYIGLYNPVNGERLPIVNDQSGENAVVLSEIMVK